jgi:vitamin K-dependent gamma-carboxylase
MKATAKQSSLLERLCAHLFRPVDISFLVFFRIVFGAIMLWEGYRFFNAGWISRYYIEPVVYFTYYGFSWVRPWPGRGMYLHFFALGVLAFCVLIGLCYRIAAPFFFLGFTYVFLLDQTRYLNHFYLICLISFLMIFLPAERTFSVDAWLRPKLRSEVAPAWTLWLLRAQVGIAYFFGGIAKINSDWLRGGEPMRTWLSPFVGLPAIGPLFKAEWVVYSFVYGGMLLDLLVVPLLLWRRTRPYAFAASVIFNLINAVIFNIGIFPWFMLGATLIFFPPDLMRRFARAFMSPGAAMREPAPDVAAAFARQGNCPALSGRQKLIAALLAAYMLVQMLMPLRHFLYPGNVSWTEEGHNFAWHMKLRTKRGEAVFTVKDPTSGQTWTVDPLHNLQPRQYQKMAAKPEMILQYGHHLARQKRLEGYQNVEVRARVEASLNGRRPQLLVDPTVDLTKVRSSILPANWIVPLTTPLEARGKATEGEADE